MRSGMVHEYFSVSICRVSSIVSIGVPSYRLLGHLATTFEPRRQALLRARALRAEEIDGGHLPRFLEETKAVREAEWKVAPPPDDILDRRVEITGPVYQHLHLSTANSVWRTTAYQFVCCRCVGR